MNSSTKAGYLNGRSEMSKSKYAKMCLHGRVLDRQYDNGKLTGNVVCRECGAVIPDPVNVGD